MDSLPTMTRIFSMVIQHERQGNFNVNDESKALINVVDYKRLQGRAKGFGQGFKNSRRVCTHCGRTGHIVNTCYRKHGFPHHLQKGNTSMANNVNNDVAELKEELSTHGEMYTGTPSFTQGQ